MPEKRTVERARKKARAGKAPSTQAGEFVREEIHHVREGKHGVRSPQQAIAIGLSKARRAGVKLGPPPSGKKVSGKRTRPSARCARGRRIARQAAAARRAATRRPARLYAPRVVRDFDGRRAKRRVLAKPRRPSQLALGGYEPVERCPGSHARRGPRRLVQWRRR